jgi:hypothetical protein
LPNISGFDGGEGEKIKWFVAMGTWKEKRESFIRKK